VVVGSDHLVRQAEFVDKLERGGLAERNCPGGLDGAAVHVHGFDHAAQARAGFDDSGRGAAFGQVISGGQAGDAAR